MKFIKIFIATLFVLPAMAAVQEKGFYVIEKQFLVHIKDSKQKIVEQLENKVVVKLTADERDDLVEKIHDGTNFCAGVTDVTEDYQKKGKGFLKNFGPAPQRFLGETYKIANREKTTAAIGHVSSDRFLQLIEKYTAFPDRYSNSETGKQAHEFLRDTAKELAKNSSRSDIEVTEVTTGKSYTQNSVVIKIPGADSSLPGVLLGGHMDTLKNNKPGADDDASGTVAIAEVYQAILDSGLKFKRDLYFVFYAAEEVGLVGSNVVAKQFQAKNIDLKGVLQFDMIGFKAASEQKSIHFVEDNVSSELTKYVKELASTYVGIAAKDMGRTLCNYECSDHASWNRLGYAAAFPFEAAMGTMNKDLHTARDPDLRVAGA